MAAGVPGGGDQWSVWPSSPPQRGELERRRTKEQLKRVSLQSGYRRGAPGRGSEQVSPPPFSSAHPFPPAPPPMPHFQGPSVHPLLSQVGPRGGLCTWEEKGTSPGSRLEEPTPWTLPTCWKPAALEFTHCAAADWLCDRDLEPVVFAHSFHKMKAARPSTL